MAKVAILLIAMLAACPFTLEKANAAEVTVESMRAQFIEALDHTIDIYWNEALGMFDNAHPCQNCNTQFHYWRQAHAIDILLDGYEITADDRYLEYVHKMRAGLRRRNGGHLFNDFYDDMQWMALALLRVHTLTGDPEYLRDAERLWLDIRGGWSDLYGGGIAWRKSQRDYKNAPSNGPAAILAARLYQTTGRQEYLDWATQIFSWLKANLVEPGSGLVWDGINRTGDGTIDKGWMFTYNQGTFVGAAVALWEATRDMAYLADARQTMASALSFFRDFGGVFRDEGQGDGGLFRGIMIRYFVELDRVDPGQEALRTALRTNAESLLTVRTQHGTFGPLWRPPSFRGPVDLSTQLSALKLLSGTAVVMGRTVK